MHIILKALGPQTETDLSFLTCDYSMLYVRKLEENINYSEDSLTSLTNICQDLKSGLSKKA